MSLLISLVLTGVFVLVLYRIYAQDKVLIAAFLERVDELEGIIQAVETRLEARLEEQAQRLREEIQRRTARTDLLMDRFDCLSDSVRQLREERP